MSEQAGTKELKELVKFAIEMGEAVDKALVDKKFTVDELGLLIAPLMQIGPAFEGLDQVGGEIKDLSEAELAELSAFVKEELDLENDKVEAIVEKAIEVGTCIYSLVQLFKKEEEAPEQA
jgi:hypothetical protein